MKRYAAPCVAVALVLMVAAVALHAVSASRKDGGTMKQEAEAVIAGYLEHFRPLDLELRKAWYRYDTTGDKKASARRSELELAIRKLNSDRERFAKLKPLYDARERLDDPLLTRQVEVLYLAHLPNQVAPEKLERLTEIERRMEETFNDYRAKLRGKELSPVERDHLLSDATDSAVLEDVWKSQHLVGRLLEKNYRELVALRNEIARDLGYDNALELEAVVAETSLAALDRFYEEVARATDVSFRNLKEGYIDPKLAQRYGVAVSELKPWHYQNAFFQEAPPAIFGDVDLDTLYANVDSRQLVKLVEGFYGSIGVDITGIIKRSSLYPAPGKNPHAVAWFLDPEKADSSVLVMNLPAPPTAPKAGEASTLVHELGHDINYEAILRNAALPYLLRDPTMLTEAFAMLMEGQTQTVGWFERLGVSKERAAEAVQAVELLKYADEIIFLRWSAAIYCFEREIYAHPEADIGDAWWSCRERFQFLERPEGWREPDALAKYHIAVVPPLYYSNYAIGRVANVQFDELFRRQAGDAGGDFYGRRSLGTWLMEDFLAQGLRYRWDDYLKRTTGGPLSVKAWQRRYIGSDAEKQLRVAH